MKKSIRENMKKTKKTIGNEANPKRNEKIKKK